MICWELKVWKNKLKMSLYITAFKVKKTKMGQNVMYHLVSTYLYSQMDMVAFWVSGIKLSLKNLNLDIPLPQCSLTLVNVYMTLFSKDWGDTRTTDTYLLLYCSFISRYQSYSSIDGLWVWEQAQYLNTWGIVIFLYSSLL